MVAFVNCTSDIASFARVLGWLEDGNRFGHPTPSRAYSVLEWKLSNPGSGDFRGYGILLRTLIVAISLYVYATLFTLHLPSYFRNRASPFLQSSPSEKEEFALLWATVFRPLLDKWRAVVVLSSLTASAIIGMIQASPNLTNDTFGLPLAYFTLVTGMISILLSSLMLFHVSGREHDDSFVQALSMEMKTCSAFSLWNIWIMVALPSIWSAWTTVAFITVVVLQIWRRPDTFTVSDVVSPALAAMGAPTAALDDVLQRFTVFAAALTTTLSIGIAQLLGTMVSFWRIGRRWGTIDQEGGQVVIENNTGVVASTARASPASPS